MRAIEAVGALLDEDTNLLLQYGLRDKLRVPPAAESLEKYPWRRGRRHGRHGKKRRHAGYYSQEDKCGYPILTKQSYHARLFSYVGGTSATVEKITGLLSFEPATDRRFTEAILSGLSNGAANFSDRRMLCVWSSKRMLTCTDHHDGSGDVSQSTAALAYAVAEIIAVVQQNTTLNASLEVSEIEDLREVFGLLQEKGDFTSFLTVSHFMPKSCVPAGFEFSPPGRGSLRDDLNFDDAVARVEVGYAGVCNEWAASAQWFPSLVGQTFDVHFTLFYRWLDLKAPSATGVVNITGILNFTEQVNYENQPDSNGRFVLATYSQLVASPAILTMPSTFSEVCAVSSDKMSLVCSRAVEALEYSEDTGDVSVDTVARAYTRIQTALASGNGSAGFSTPNTISVKTETDSLKVAVASASAAAGSFVVAPTPDEAEVGADALAEALDEFLDSGTEAIAEAVAEGRVMARSLRVSADTSRRFTELMHLDRFDCPNYHKDEGCTPWQIQFANPGRGSFLGSPVASTTETALDAVSVGSATRQGFQPVETEAASCALPPSCSCASGAYPSFALAGELTVTLARFSRLEIPEALPASSEVETLDARVLGQFNEQGLLDNTGRFVYMELAGGDEAKVSLAVCAYAEAGNTSLVCARTSLLSLVATAQAQVDLAAEVFVDSQGSGRSTSVAQALASAIAASTLLLDSNAEFTMELSVSSCAPSTCVVQEVQFRPAGRGTLLDYIHTDMFGPNETVGVAEAVVSIGNASATQ
ncbi:Naaa [Symbiodinium natans]|uniref:Naaa protein n=1 Tax=Symbiodinium natans TaxID=878477 RepID=A0A812K3K3_9DINO|nr:Naaa [Symbiodinium natans]